MRQPPPVTRDSFLLGRVPIGIPCPGQEFSYEGNSETLGLSYAVKIDVLALYREAVREASRGASRVLALPLPSQAEFSVRHAVDADGGHHLRPPEHGERWSEGGVDVDWSVVEHSRPHLGGLAVSVAGVPLLIDGHHRIAKAALCGLPWYPVLTLSTDRTLEVVPSLTPLIEAARDTFKDDFAGWPLVEH